MDTKRKKKYRKVISGIIEDKAYRNPEKVDAIMDILLKTQDNFQLTERRIQQTDIMFNAYNKNKDNVTSSFNICCFPCILGYNICRSLSKFILIFLIWLLFVGIGMYIVKFFI